MVRDILGSNAMGKLKGILQSRYGMGLQIKFMQEVSALSFQEGGFHIRRGDMHIPIYVEEKFLATAIVEKGGTLETTDRQTVSQLVRLFLEPELFNWYISQMTHNLKVKNDDDEIPSIYEPYQAAEEAANFHGSTNVLCLQAKNPQLIQRLAQNIHDLSERWAFLRYSDIQQNIQSAQDIRTLGTLTLVVDDVLQLHPDQQEIVYQFISNSSPGEEPLLILGCTSLIEDLESQKMIHAGLARVMKAHRLEIERLPRDPKLLQESLEIMLEF